VPNEKDVKIISMGAMENGSQRSNGYHEYSGTSTKPSEDD
jgi:hypothetical protein